MGANLGGIAERIRDGVDGWLLPYRDVAAWTNAMSGAARDRAAVARLKANVRVSRTMEDVGAEMADIYRQVLASGPTSRG